jgi:Flp pilus assembly pilin Flp
MTAIVNLLVKSEAGATPIEFALLAAVISIVVIFGLLLIER